MKGEMCTVVNRLCNECEEFTVIDLPKVCTVIGRIETYDPKIHGKLNMVIGR